MKPPIEAVRQRYAAAIDALNRRDWATARREAEAIVPTVPGHAGVHFVVGVAALELGDLKAAFRHLLQATRLNPQRTDYAAQWARVLLSCRRQREAVQEAARALALGPTDPVTFNTLGVVFSRANAHAQAAEAFARAVELAPEEASYRFNLSTSLVAVGDIPGAARQCEACIGLQPTFWRAHLELAQIERQSEARNHLPRLRELLHRHGQAREAALYLNLALEKELDDLKQYLQAFDHLVRGKAAWRAHLDYASARDEALFESVIAADRAVPRNGGHPSEEPIFVIGMPRSGTTLVERIVSSHSRVHAAGELPNFSGLLHGAGQIEGGGGAWSAASIARLAAADWAALGKAYVDSTRPLTGHTPHFVDKLPHNFMYAGFIARALPRAKIICLRRDPMDTCVANFRQLFTLGSSHFDYSFDLLDVGRYYLMFDRLMRHWQASMPGRILEVHYEDVVDHQEQTTRALLQHCNLPWEDACLHFERNAAPTSTASAVQVRSGIYRTSLQRWQRYGDRVAPLRRLLAEAGVVAAD